MVSRQEKQKWIIENCTNSFGEIDLSKLDFGDRNIFLDQIKTKGNIYNTKQEAKYIYNEGQKAIIINNLRQEANYYVDNRLKKQNNKIRIKK